MAKMPLPDKAELKTARLARTLVASVFVAGITALIATQPDAPPDASSRPATSELDFLHAPAQDPSLPTAEHVFADRPPALGEPVPTF